MSDGLTEVTAALHAAERERDDWERRYNSAIEGRVVVRERADRAEALLAHERKVAADRTDQALQLGDHLAEVERERDINAEALHILGGSNYANAMRANRAEARVAELEMATCESRIGVTAEKAKELRARIEALEGALERIAREAGPAHWFTTIARAALAGGEP